MIPPKITCTCGACQTCRTRESLRKWRAQNRERNRANMNAWHARNSARRNAAKYAGQDPVKTSAQRAVCRAVARGDLTRMPCEVCGAEPAHGHHDDYSKPLEVRWLCPIHHAAAHAPDQRAA